MANAVVSKIVPKSCGNPKLITTLPENDPRKEIKLGRVIGLIRGVAVRKDPTGEKIVALGLKGTFRSTPDAATQAEFKQTDTSYDSGILYLPDYVQDEIIALYHDMPSLKNNIVKDSPNPPAAPITLAVDVYTIKATNPQGYSWKFQPVLEATEVAQTDPFAVIEGQIAEQQKKLEAPKADAGKARK